MICFFVLPAFGLMPSRSCCRFRRSSDMTCFISRAQGYNIQSLGKHIDLFAVKREYFPVNHDVNWAIQIEFDAVDRLAFRKRMLDVGAVVESGQIADQAETPDRSPAHVFD